MRIPSFRWASGAEVWNCMLEKDATYSKLRSERLLDRHPSLVHSYRTILFDWLSEVSHECKFHRETYHLALDFIDRYLAATSNVGKYQLQLIGTTCLFLAAKYEEIRPPTVIEFAELTDGACKAEDIIDNEVVILSALGWEITPMTPNNWLNIYMQVLHNPNQIDCDSVGSKQQQQQQQQEEQKQNSNSDKSTVPLAIKCLHKRIASVIDLAILHIDSLRYRNSILAAAAIRHFIPEKCSGFTQKELDECHRWLEPFVEVIQSIDEAVFMATCKGTHPTQMHSHIATVNLIEQVLELMGAKRSLESTTNLKRKAYCLEDSEDEHLIDHQEVTSTTILLTPPSSTSKVRKQLKRHHNSTSSLSYSCQTGECSPPPPPAVTPQRQPLQLQQHQSLLLPPPPQLQQQHQQPKASLHAHCRGEKV